MTANVIIVARISDTNLEKMGAILLENDEPHQEAMIYEINDDAYDEFYNRMESWGKHRRI